MKHFGQRLFLLASFFYLQFCSFTDLQLISLLNPPYFVLIITFTNCGYSLKIGIKYLLNVIKLPITYDFLLRYSLQILYLFQVFPHQEKGEFNTLKYSLLQSFIPISLFFIAPLSILRWWFSCILALRFFFLKILFLHEIPLVLNKFSPLIQRLFVCHLHVFLVISFFAVFFQKLHYCLLHTLNLK